MKKAEKPKKKKKKKEKKERKQSEMYLNKPREKTQSRDLSCSEIRDIENHAEIRLQKS